MASAPKQPKRRKTPRGQTVIHVLALLYLAYKLHQKVSKKVEKLAKIQEKK